MSIPASIAVRPPEYFPRIPFWQLMQSVDCFVVADTFQYSRQSFQNRTKVRNPTGWQWLSIPLMGRQHGEPIAQARIDTHAPWPGKHRRALAFNYRTTPYFEYYEAEVERFFSTPWTVLGDATWASIELVYRLLGLETRLVRASSIPGRPAGLGEVMRAYPGAELRVLPDTERHDRATFGKVEVVAGEVSPYRQNYPGFEPGMSILDMLFNYGPEVAQHLAGALRQYRGATRSPKP